MELQKPKEPICILLDILEPLPELKGPYFPSVKDVIRKFFHHLWSRPKNNRDVTDTAWKTAESLLEVWRPSYIPLMSKFRTQKKILALFKEFGKYRHAKKESKPRLDKFSPITGDAIYHRCA
jgi:hypothetical protein